MSDTSLNKIIQYGTVAQRIAFIPNPAAGSKVLYIWYDTDAAPNTYIWNGTVWVQINGGGGATDFTGLADVPASYTGQAGKVVTVNATATGLEFTTPSGGGGAWVLAASWTHSVNVAVVDFINLGAYTEIYIILRLVTTSGVAFRRLLVGSDNGISFYNALGDYHVISNTGIGVDVTFMSFHNGAQSAGVTAWGFINMFNLTTLKTCYTTDAVGNMPFLITPVAAMNALRVFNSSGATFTGGTILVYGR